MYKILHNWYWIFKQIKLKMQIFWTLPECTCIVSINTKQTSTNDVLLFCWGGVLEGVGLNLFYFKKSYLKIDLIPK